VPDSDGAPYPELLTQLDHWSAETSRRHPGVIPCRAGCAACCHGPFDISVADAVMIRAAVRRLPDGARLAIAEGTGRLAGMIRALAPDWVEPWDIAAIGDDRFDSISETLVDEPCPLLDSDGACRIYHSRPLICRWMGLGMVAENGRTIENACPIQDQFPGYAALPPQPFELEPFEAREATCLEDAAEALLGDSSRYGFETTIALALLQV
jgi:Fe-S-cluster containining protein